MDFLLKMSKNIFTKAAFFLTMIFVLQSCITSRVSVTDEETVVWPFPPDTARIQYLMSFSNSADITGDQSWFNRVAFGVSKIADISKPYGVTSVNSKLYICDLNKIEIIDLEKHSFKTFTPDGAGQLSFATNCFVDESGYLYVADGNKKKVLIFDSEGNFLTHIDGPENFKPMDVLVSDNRIFICDLSGNKVGVYEKGTNKYLYQIPDTARVGSVEHLYSPLNISIIGDKIYVSDVGNYKVKIYNKNTGKFISAFGGNGKNPGNFIRNKGVALDRDTNVFVVDGAFENIQMFNGNNDLLMFFGGPYKKKGDMWLPAKVYINYDNVKYFEKYLDPEYDAKYLIFVTNQFGPDKVSVYARVEPTKATPEEKAKKKKKVKKAREKRIKRKGKSLL